MVYHRLCSYLHVRQSHHYHREPTTTPTTTTGSARAGVCDADGKVLAQASKDTRMWQTPMEEVQRPDPIPDTLSDQVTF